MIPDPPNPENEDVYPQRPVLPPKKSLVVEKNPMFYGKVLINEECDDFASSCYCLLEGAMKAIDNWDMEWKVIFEVKDNYLTITVI